MKPNPRLIPRLNVRFGPRDLLLALGDHSEAETSTLDALSEMWPDRFLLPVDSGRTAVFLALRALRLPKGAKVGVPLYACEVLFDAIVRAGCRPVFLDIDMDTYTLSPTDLLAKLGNLDAVVPIHLFGHPTDMQGVGELTGNLRVLEDCAHAIGTKFRGNAVGQFGDCAIFTFRLGKPMSAGDVAILVCKDKNVFKRAARTLEELPAPRPRLALPRALRLFGTGILYQPPLYGLLSLPLGQLVDERLDLMDKRAFEPHAATGGFVAVLGARLLDHEASVAETRAHAHDFSRAIGSGNLHPPVEASWAYHTYYQFAIRFRNQESRDRAANRLRRANVDSIPFYSGVPGAARSYGYDGDCPNAELAAETVLTVPCHANLTALQVTTIRNSLQHLASDAIG